MVSLYNPYQILRRQGENEEFHLIPTSLDIRVNVINTGIERRFVLQVNQHEIIDSCHNFQNNKGLGVRWVGVNELNPGKFFWLL